nr:PREDICTED: protein ZNF365 [Latimeria chalumnae]XP_014344954.1 PREDICTED: protein ZNF365 [Latimeria chalumnae]XP_014344955.1 PREDICTED: protein ZNF365 [Latimeria chalumnae]|eukprot:XP_014344953.1 PREDICTED: protein ZNF365 [Latimeria chalumnae]
MQKTLERENYGPQTGTFGNVKENLPFRCPRCGEHTRFKSLSSLRAHLEYSHSYEEVYRVTKCRRLSSFKHTESIKPSELFVQELPENAVNQTKQKQSVKFYNLLLKNTNCSKDKVENDEPWDLTEMRCSKYTQTEQKCLPDLSRTSPRVSFEAHLQEKYEDTMEAIDKAVEKRIEKLASELAVKTAELLEVKAEYLQLAQKKQEIQTRERVLSRQVDVAVEMIAMFRQQLTESEQELYRKEQEIFTINHLLEAAAEKEAHGKAKLQEFIESLLQRIAFIERQLDYYYYYYKQPMRRKHPHSQPDAFTGARDIRKIRDMDTDIVSVGRRAL